MTGRAVLNARSGHSIAGIAAVGRHESRRPDLSGGQDKGVSSFQRRTACHDPLANFSRTRPPMRLFEQSSTWKEARAEGDDLTEADACSALQQLDPLWDELFPAEQARIVALLIKRVDIGAEGLNVGGRCRCHN